MRSYELMYILDPTLDEDASKSLVGKIEDLMSKQGVQIENTEPWGKRRLAYSIQGHWEGNYVLSHLKAPPTAIAEMERRLKVTDGILRFLTVRVDKEQAKAERRKERRETKDRARRERRAAAAESRREAEQASSAASEETRESTGASGASASGETTGSEAASPEQES